MNIGKRALLRTGLLASALALAAGCSETSAGGANTRDGIGTAAGPLTPEQAASGRSPTLSISQIFEMPAIPPSDAEGHLFGPTAVALVRTFFETAADRDDAARLVPFVADARNHTIRRIEMDQNVTVTVAGTAGVAGSADGAATVARFRQPRGLAASHDALFVADTLNHTIRRIALPGMAVTTVAGAAMQHGHVDASAACAVPCNQARFDMPAALAYAPGTQTLYVADTGNNRVRSIAFSSSGVVVSTLDVALSRPEGLLYDEVNHHLYVADTGNHVVRRIDVGGSGGAVVVAGVEGVYGPTAAKPHALAAPSGLAISDGALLIADYGSNTLQRVRLDETSSGAAPTTVVAGKPFRPFGPENPFRSPVGLAASIGKNPNGSPRTEQFHAAHHQQLYVVDQGRHVLAVLPRTLAATGQAVGDGSVVPASEIAVAAGVAGRPGSSDGWPAGTDLGAVGWMACDDHTLYVRGRGIHAITPATGAVRTISPFDLGGMLAVTSTSAYVTTSYGDVEINLQTLQRTPLTQPGGPGDELQFAPVTIAGAGDEYFAFMTHDSFGYGLFKGPNLETATGGAHIGYMTGAGDTLYYTTDRYSSDGSTYRLLVGASTPERVAASAPDFFATDGQFIYLVDQGTNQLVRRPFPASPDDDFGAPEAIADGAFASVTLQQMAICVAGDRLYTADTAGGIYSVNLGNQSVTPIDPTRGEGCSEQPLSDISGAPDGWQFQNGTPGDRGGYWRTTDGNATYYFFYDASGFEGSTFSSQAATIARTLPSFSNGTHLRWTWSNAWGVQDVTMNASLDLRVQPVGACAGRLSLSRTLHISATNPVSETTSLDVTPLAGCPVQIIAHARHAATITGGTPELSGRFTVSGVTFASGACLEN